MLYIIKRRVLAIPIHSKEVPVGQMYIDYIEKFLKKVANTQHIIPEEWDYPIYKLRDGTFVSEPVPKLSDFYYLTGPQKGQPLEDRNVSLQPANKMTLAGLHPTHYPINGVTPVEGRDGRRYVLEAERGNPFGLKPGDAVPDNWRSISDE